MWQGNCVGQILKVFHKCKQLEVSANSDDYN